jgi:gamma-glutamylputrescine oxidase
MCAFQSTRFCDFASAGTLGPMQSFYLNDSPSAPAMDAWPTCQYLPCVVVGGGYAGLNTALGLAERGVASIVLESKHIAFGASGRNGGFVFAGYSLGESALLKALGPELAFAWYQRTVAAVNLIRQRIQNYGIDCDAIDAGVLWANWFNDADVLKARQTLLAAQFNTHWQALDRGELSKLLATTRYSGALFERNALQINPLKFARGLAQAARKSGAQIVEGVEVLAIEPIAGKNDARWRVRSNLGVIECRDVVLACGGYLQGQLAQSLPQLRRALLPVATYVIATEKLGDLQKSVINTQAAIYDTRFAFDYYRATADTRIIWGGRIHVLDAPPDKIAQLLKRDMVRVYPQLREVRIEHAWSGLMSYARHEMPQIGTLQPGLWYAQAFGGHGIAPTCVAGEALADAIALGEQRYQQLAPFGLSRTYGVLGLVGAQCKYWWLQGQDAWRGY